MHACSLFSVLYSVRILSLCCAGADHTTMSYRVQMFGTVSDLCVLHVLELALKSTPPYMLMDLVARRRPCVRWHEPFETAGKCCLKITTFILCITSAYASRVL
uniref:Secreted peptide n=1 Tax=Anopheles braziliensis TaxID=58242 RepID=A0A2M3ZLP2_9DIPT